MSRCANVGFCSGTADPRSVVRGVCVLCDVLSVNHIEFIKGEECAVCLLSNPQSMKWPGGCGHSFCVNCMHKWINKVGATCPMCRSPIACNWVLDENGL